MRNLNRCLGRHGITQWVRKIVFFNVGYSVTARSAMYNQHEAIITNHVPRQCTLMFSYSALNYSYLVLHVRANASILYTNSEFQLNCMQAFLRSNLKIVFVFPYINKLMF